MYYSALNDPIKTDKRRETEQRPAYYRVVQPNLEWRARYQFAEVWSAYGPPLKLPPKWHNKILFKHSVTFIYIELNIHFV